MVELSTRCVGWGFTRQRRHAGRFNVSQTLKPRIRAAGGNPVPGEPCKAEGTVSEDIPPIADGHAEDPSLEESAARVKWPATSDKAAWTQLDEDLSKVLAGEFKAGSLRCLASFGEIVYRYCKERFGVLEQREPHPRTNKESRRQAEIREVRAQLRQLKKAWKAASQQRKPEVDILRPLYDRVRREAVAGTLFAIWSWLSQLCGNFSHDVPPQAWHHPPRAQVCTCKAASNAALRASTWIWAKHRNGPSCCHQAPVRSGSGVSALVHWPTSPMWYWV